MSLSFRLRPRPLRVLGIGNVVVDWTLVTDLSMPLVAGDESTRLPVGANLVGLPAATKAKVFSFVRQHRTVSRRAGGAELNAVRMLAIRLHALGERRNCTAFLGAAGTDENAALVEKECESAGVEPLLVKIRAQSTGECAILVDGSSRERTICCNRGASAELSMEVVEKEKEKMKWMEEKAETVVVSACFAITTRQRFEVVKDLAARFGNAVMSLSSAEMMKQNAQVRDWLEEIWMHTSIVFGTKDEVAELCAHRFPNGTVRSVEMAAQMLAGLLRDEEAMVVVTDGPGDVIVARQTSFQKYPLEKVELPENIVDTNGCGDAFQGGFLASFIKTGADRRFEREWVLEGCKCASATLRTHGINLDFI